MEVEDKIPRTTPSMKREELRRSNYVPQLKQNGALDTMAMGQLTWNHQKANLDLVKRIGGVGKEEGQETQVEGTKMFVK